MALDRSCGLPRPQPGRLRTEHAPIAPLDDRPDRLAHRRAVGDPALAAAGPAALAVDEGSPDQLVHEQLKLGLVRRRPPDLIDELLHASCPSSTASSASSAAMMSSSRSRCANSSASLRSSS